MKNFGLAISAVLMFFGTATLASEVWQCDIPSQKRNSFIGGPIVIAVDESTGKSVASSPLILAVNGAPLVVEISKNTSSVLRAKWSIKNIEDSKGNYIPSMRYSAIIQKATGGLNYYAKSARYDKTMGASGRCKRLK